MSALNKNSRPQEQLVYLDSENFDYGYFPDLS